MNVRHRWELTTEDLQSIDAAVPSVKMQGERYLACLKQAVAH